MPETEIIRDEKRKGGNFWLFVTLLFFGILSFLVYTSFYDDSFAKKITSNVISDTSSTYEIEGTLSVPEELVIDSSIKKISLKIKEPSEISVGNQIIQLSKDSSIVIDNFQGSFVIGIRKISTVDGSSSQIFINGMPLQSKSGSLEIQGENFDYGYTALDDVSFDKLSYIATGTLTVNKGKITIRLDREQVLLKEFRGNIEITKNYMKLQGISKDFSVEDFIQKPDTTKKNNSVN